MKRQRNQWFRVRSALENKNTNLNFGGKIFAERCSNPALCGEVGRAPSEATCGDGGTKTSRLAMIGSARPGHKAPPKPEISDGLQSHQVAAVRAANR